MADIKISELAEATSLSESDVLAGVNAATTRKFSLARLKAFFFSALTKADVGLGNVANVLQYSADNKPTPLEIGAVPETRTVNGKALAQDVVLDAADVGAQEEITASGILKGDGAGGVSAATAGTDYATPAQIPAASSNNPAMDGTASPGSSTLWARGDHVHPSDTSKQDVLTFDATPTSGSSNPVTSGGVYDAVQTRLPKYGMGKNLLDNWYLVGGGSQQGGGQLPINQRGQTSYSGTGYGIDGWKQTRAEVQQVVQSDCLRMNAVSALASGNLIYCNFFCPKLPAGTHTLSLLVKEATGSGGWYVSSDSSAAYPIGNVRLNAGLVTKTFTATGNETSPQFYLWHQGALAVGDHLDLIAVKLELGSEQTLAHQENGTWVLNEIPDYEYELYRCMTSTADSTDTYANKTLATIQDCVVVNIPSFSSLPQTVSNAAITANHVLQRAELGTPSAQTGDWTITTANGSLTVSGSISGSTTLKLTLGLAGTTI